MSPDLYVRLVAGLVSGDPERVRAANRELYKEIVVQPGPRSDTIARAEREADLALAKAVNQGRS